MTIKQRLKKITELQTVETPWEFKRIFGKLDMHGNLIAIADSNGDFVSEQEMQKALEWLIAELGGTVKWQK